MFLEKLKDIRFGEDSQVFPQNDKWSSRIYGSTWRSLPNVRDFHIKVKNNNSLYEYFGLKKRNRPNISISLYRNGKYNVYAHRQLKRLERFKSNPTKFFRIFSYVLDLKYLGR